MNKWISLGIIVIMVLMYLKYAPASINPLSGFFARLLRTRGIRHYADAAIKADSITGKKEGV